MHQRGLQPMRLVMTPQCSKCNRNQYSQYCDNLLCRNGCDMHGTTLCVYHGYDDY